VHKPKIYKKKLPRKKLQDGGYIKDGVTLFCCMKICFVSVLFGISSKFMGCPLFDLPLMEYEGIIDIVTWNFFIADFHVLGLFIAKKHDLSEKKNSVCHAPGPFV
jgi:hypothetical protein